MHTCVASLLGQLADWSSRQAAMGVLGNMHVLTHHTEMCMCLSYMRCQIHKNEMLIKYALSGGGEASLLHATMHALAPAARSLATSGRALHRHEPLVTEMHSKEGDAALSASMKYDFLCALLAVLLQ